MRIKSFIEISAVFALAAIAATLTTCATPANAQPIKNEDSIGFPNFTSGGAFAYPVLTHKSSGFGLVANNHLAHMPRFNAAFLCVSFSTSVMVRLDGEAFAPASFLSDLSTNLIQSNRLHLVVNDSTSINHLEVNYHD